MLSGIKRFLLGLVSAIAALVGTLIAVALILAGVFGAGAAMGRSLDLVQGAMPRSVLSLEVAMDGWALFFGAYILLWLPLSAVVRIFRSPSGPDPNDWDEEE
jgi:hypothetical protein